jgi:hypothetical protein
MCAMAAAAWTPSELGHALENPTRLPEELELLTAHLTDYGRQLLANELAEAMRGPDPVVAAARVFSG